MNIDERWRNSSYSRGYNNSANDGGRYQPPAKASSIYFFASNERIRHGIHYIYIYIHGRLTLYLLLKLGSDSFKRLRISLRDDTRYLWIRCLRISFFFFFFPLSRISLSLSSSSSNGISISSISRDTFIASLDTLTIPSVISKYIHTYERERRVRPGKDCFYRREAGLLPFHRARQTTTALSKRVVEPASPLRTPSSSSSSSSLDERLTRHYRTHLSFNPLPFNSLFRVSSSVD